MKKITESAEKVCEVFDHPFDEYLEAVNALITALIERRQLERTSITEDWLKEHGWLQNGMTQEDLEACDWENCDDTWCHPTEEISIYIDYPKNKILFCQDDNHEIWINNSLADFYDALDLCGIKID